MNKSHPGFKSVQSHIASSINHKTGKPYGKAAAGKILAFASRHASAHAKASNPRLNKV